MGSALSAQSKDERRRRSNRLSKPLAKRQSTHTTEPIPPPPPAAATAAVNDGPSTAVSPRVRASQRAQEPRVDRYAPSRALASEVERDRRRRVQSFPNLTQLSSSRPGSMGRHLSEPILEEGLEASYFPLGARPQTAADRQMRRRSFHPPASDSSSLLYPRGREPPKRAHSVHYAPRSTETSRHDTALDEITRSNTHFPVDSQRFSLTRRRSLLTRPGIATRGSRPNSLRIPSPIRQEREGLYDGSVESTGSPQPPVSSSDVDQQTAELHRGRPITPGNLEYAQLGALKLGSLRVVNGTASPSPSDMGEKGLTASTTYFSGNHGGSTRDPSLSPFSSETSSGNATTPDTKSTSVCDDEGIALQDGESSSEDISRVSTNSSAAPHAKLAIEDRIVPPRPTQLTKADSGYSSATSDRSSRGTRPRKSMDSQVYDQNTENTRRAGSVRQRAGIPADLHRQASQTRRSKPLTDPARMNGHPVPQPRGSPAQYDSARRPPPAELRTVRSTSHLQLGGMSRSNSLPHRFVQPNARDLSYAQQSLRVDAAARIYNDRHYCASQPELAASASGHHRMSMRDGGGGGLHRSDTDPSSLQELSSLKRSRQQLLSCAETGLPPIDMHLRRPEWSRSGSHSSSHSGSGVTRRKSMTELAMLDYRGLGTKPKRAPRYRSAVPGEDIPPIPALPAPGSLLRMQSYGDLGFPVGNQQGWRNNTTTAAPMRKADVPPVQQYRRDAAYRQKAPPVARGLANRQLAVR